MRCKHVDCCPMFALFSLKAGLRIWQAHYCEKSPERCERIRMEAAGSMPPADLLPNGRMIAADEALAAGPAGGPVAPPSRPR